MQVLTRNQMQRVDEETINRFCPGIELMERAGKQVASEIVSLFGTGPAKATIFVGPGNNGGDALVVARLLGETGYDCSVHLLKSPESFTVDAMKNYQRFSDLAKQRKNLREFDSAHPTWPKAVERDLENATLIVDGLFGTGLTGPVRGKAVELIEVINTSLLPVISIDIPSGVDADTGEAPGETIQADLTVTMGCPKLGLLFQPGKTLTGDLMVADIGFPDEVVEKQAGNVYLLDAMEAADRTPQRPPDTHKYQCGHLLIIAGSRTYSGAALLAGEAALRSGCGMVTIAVPEGIRNIVEAGLIEAITIPLPETPEGTIAKSALKILEPHIEAADALAVGPGLARSGETDELVKAIVTGSAGKPIIIDADGINAFASQCDALSQASAPVIITPHSGELKKLLGREIATIPIDKIEQSRSIAKELNVVLLHKGAPTIIASPEGEVVVSLHGNSALATAGSGDVLTGLIGGFLAQGAERFDAAGVACFLHGRAGEIASEELGLRGIIAGDLLTYNGEAMTELESLL